MKQGFGIAALTLLLAGHAAAQPEESSEPEEGAAETEGSAAEQGPDRGSMDTTDPAETETAEKGRFSPTEQAKRKREGESEEDVGDLPPKDTTKTEAGLDVIIGFGSVPETGAGNPVADASSFSFVPYGAHDVSESATLGLRIPWSTGTYHDVEDESAQALGNPEIFGEYRLTLGKRTDLPLRAGIGIPVAQGEPDRTNTSERARVRQADINRTADAASGWIDGELFTTRRLPVALGVGFRHRRARLSAEAFTKLVLLPKLSGEINTKSDANGSYELNGLALRSVTGISAGYAVLEQPRITPELAGWLVYRAIDPIEYSSGGGAAKPSRVQLVVEPRASARFGQIGVSAGYVLPIGGQLGDAGMQGIRLSGSYHF